MLPARKEALATSLASAVVLDAERLEEPIGNLSGGNKQRVLLGRAVATRPLLWLLDDPNRGIDVAGLPELIEQMRALAGRGRWILLTSADPAFVRAAADVVIEIGERDGQYWWGDSHNHAHCRGGE
jgi:ABC-type sugar transport system ATPase subunit